MREEMIAREVWMATTFLEMKSGHVETYLAEEEGRDLALQNEERAGGVNKKQAYLRNSQKLEAMSIPEGDGQESQAVRQFEVYEEQVDPKTFSPVPRDGNQPCPPLATQWRSALETQWRMTLEKREKESLRPGTPAQ